MKRILPSLLLALALGAPLAARAQLGPLSTSPVPDLGAVVDQTRDDVTRQADHITQPARQALQEARRLQARNLMQTHRRELEADPNGHPVVRSQILAYGVSANALAQAHSLGFEIVRQDNIGGESMVTLRAPEGMQTRRALRRLRDADPRGVYDFDHLHLESSATSSALQFAQAYSGRAGPRIGLIDSGVSGAVAAQRAFASEAPVAAAHGTAIAAILSHTEPGVRIYAADIYGGAPTGGASSALARALAWLASENTPVINVSLVGPRNRIVEAVIARMTARGFILVAAVGNDGPAAPPLYPAGYDGVVGVTGVDARERVLVEAGRGSHVDFSALGLYDRVRGTSYAAPIVAAQLARHAQAVNASAAHNAINLIRNEARDLGARGRDDIYGYGLVSAR